MIARGAPQGETDQSMVIGSPRRVPPGRSTWLALHAALLLAVAAWLAGVAFSLFLRGFPFAHLSIGVLGLAALGTGYLLLRRWLANLLIREERFRLITSVAMDYMFSSTVEMDGTLTLQWVAGAFEGITGYTFDEYVARGGWRTALHLDDRAQDERDLQGLRSNQPLRTELRTLAKDGRIVWVEVFAHPIWDEKQNRLSGIYGAVRDITRRKQAEAETQATLDTLEQFVDSVPAFGAFVDNEERYQFVNRFHENWFKESRRHFVGRKLSEVHRPSTYAIMQPHSQQALAGQFVRYEHEMTGRDGKYYCFDVQYIPRRASEGPIQGYFSLVFDITERVLRERQLLRTQRLESVGRLASGIAHDLNNILSPMLMGPDLIRESVQDPAVIDILDLIESSARRGAAILKQLLMFGRGDSEVCAALNLGPLIREMMKIIQETFPKNISVSHRISPDLPSIRGNVTHLHQVLMNLCINARDAMPSGGQLSLTAQVEEVDAALAKRHAAPRAGPHVVLCVGDTGMGIPPEVMDKIFDPFYTTKPIGQGTGLGLSTVLGIAQSHHGFIRVDSPPGQGTRFFIYLPVSSEGAAQAEPNPTSPTPKGRGERILLVDDEPSARLVTRKILENNGYRILEARNGAEALAIFKPDPTRVQLVITDLMMPGMDGVALIRALRELDPHVKTMAITGGVSQTEMAQALEAESAAFLLKPFGSAVLLETVHRVLQS